MTMTKPLIRPQNSFMSGRFFAVIVVGNDYYKFFSFLFCHEEKTIFHIAPYKVTCSANKFGNSMEYNNLVPKWQNISKYWQCYFFRFGLWAIICCGIYFGVSVLYQMIYDIWWYIFGSISICVIITKKAVFNEKFLFNAQLISEE